MLRKLLVSFGTGMLLIGMSWAGTGLVPVPVPGDNPQSVGTDGGKATIGATSVDTGLPPGGDLTVGAVAVSIDPDPDPDAGERWQTEGCATGFTNDEIAEQRKTTTPDCLYMGGRGLGPSEPITAIDPANPLYVRAVAIGDGANTAVVVQVDGVYWFGRYESFCERCGAYDIIEDLSDELGLDPSSILIAGNHSHNSPDFIGGWGAVPTWYMEQVGEAIRDAIRGAVGGMEPATIEVGEQVARHLNVERRSFYYSAEDATFTWFRALAVPEDEAAPVRTLATVGAFSAHPVTTGYQNGLSHADWPGAFDQEMRERTGGIGIAFVAGLGNMSTRQGTWDTARGLADLLPQAGAGRQLASTDVRTAISFWDQPITNAGLIGLRSGKFFDRPVDGAPAVIEAGKSNAKPCRSAGPIAVRTSVSAVRIGDALVITGGPGELFSNLTNTVKDRSAGAVALPLANVNDGLGYIMQSFETDHAARQVLGFTDAPVEYEDAFGLDACFGDMALQRTLQLLANL